MALRLNPEQHRRCIENEIREAALRLGRSEVGREMLRSLGRMLSECALSLDGPNQDATLTLLSMAWSGKPETVCEAIDRALRAGS